MKYIALIEEKNINSYKKEKVLELINLWIIEEKNKILKEIRTREEQIYIELKQLDINILNILK